MRFKKRLSCVSRPHLNPIHYNSKLKIAIYLSPINYISEIPGFLHNNNKRIDERDINLFNFRFSNYKALAGKECKNISSYSFSINKYNEIISTSYKWKGDVVIENDIEENLKPKYPFIYNKGISSEAFKTHSNSVMIPDNQPYDRNIPESMFDFKFNSETELARADFEDDLVYKKFIGFGFVEIKSNNQNSDKLQRRIL